MNLKTMFSNKLLIVIFLSLITCFNSCTNESNDLNGYWSKKYSSGIISAEGYNDNGIPAKVRKNYYSDGSMLSAIYYSDNNTYKSLTFYPDGMINTYYEGVIIFDKQKKISQKSKVYRMWDNDGNLLRQDADMKTKYLTNARTLTISESSYSIQNYTPYIYGIREQDKYNIRLFLVPTIENKSDKHVLKSYSLVITQEKSKNWNVDINNSSPKNDLQIDKIELKKNLLLKKTTLLIHCKILSIKGSVNNLSFGILI